MQQILIRTSFEQDSIVYLANDRPQTVMDRVAVHALGHGFAVQAPQQKTLTPVPLNKARQQAPENK